MKKNFAIVFFLVLLFMGCKKGKEINAQAIIDKAIAISGVEHLQNSTIGFDFRNIHYSAIRNSGKFQFERVFTDSINEVRDVFNNFGFKRYINEDLVQIPDSMGVKYSSSINSVHYFSVLPFGLNDAAVNKKYIGKVEINKQKYYKIKVTFNKEGGGEDFEDVFIYWIHVGTFKIDYLAYSYIEDYGAGLRFRQAYNERLINGIRFVDYNNFKPRDDKVLLEKLDYLFEANQLLLLSNIELENITVE